MFLQSLAKLKVLILHSVTMVPGYQFPKYIPILNILKKLDISGNWQIAPDDMMQTVKPLESLVWLKVMHIPDF